MSKSYDAKVNETQAMVHRMDCGCEVAVRLGIFNNRPENMGMASIGFEIDAIIYCETHQGIKQ